MTVDISRINDNCSSGIEEIADDFAEALLMPEENVRDFIKDNMSIGTFCNEFQVPQDAAIRRLKKLGYKIDKEENR